MELKFRENTNSFTGEVRDIINGYNNEPFTIHNVFGDVSERWHFMEPAALYNKVRFAVHYLHRAGEIESIRRERNATVFRAITEDKYAHFKG